ncbi:MAG TPA: FliH/SctL family protein [Syntrophales bacterium]|nr:FliH/SctL family protein [Syntrophales bacterium]HOX93444.1 FliH/SctL family protein [Syntrophales bacterium]HPI56663.1 FliH/SctL family protein [Syntrophales bacterium]HPN24911.1 FliH/SctL family protein [Syntrophales bacterium]HQM29720.1 FliH/SctL family protein [Syntrophales bacterium]
MSKRVIKSSNVEIGAEVLKSGDTGPPKFIRTDFSPGQAPLRGPQKTRNRLDELRAETEKRGRAAQGEAYERGFADGSAKERRELSEAIKTAVSLILELEYIRRETLERMEMRILDLAFAIAAKVIHEEPRANPEVVVRVLKAAIHNLTDRDGIRIHVNPKDHDYLVGINPEALKEVEGLRNAVFVKDEGIKRGGTLIETAFGEVDARLEEQLSEIGKAFVQGNPADDEGT